jgi:hypothetical protein
VSFDRRGVVGRCATDAAELSTNWWNERAEVIVRIAMVQPPEGPNATSWTKVVRATAAFGSVCGCVVYVGAPRQVSTADWAAYLAYLAPLLTTTRALPRVIWDDSGGPPPLGRQNLAALTQGCPVKVAIVTDASAGRNTATVLNWNRKEESYRTFFSSELREAIAFVGLTGPAIDRVVQALLELRRDLGL